MRKMKTQEFQNRSSNSSLGVIFNHGGNVSSHKHMMMLGTGTRDSRRSGKSGGSDKYHIYYNREEFLLELNKKT